MLKPMLRFDLILRLHLELIENIFENNEKYESSKWQNILNQRTYFQCIRSKWTEKSITNAETIEIKVWKFDSNFSLKIWLKF